MRARSFYALLELHELQNRAARSREPASVSRWGLKDRDWGRWILQGARQFQSSTLVYFQSVVEQREERNREGEGGGAALLDRASPFLRSKMPNSRQMSRLSLGGAAKERSFWPN